MLGVKVLGWDITRVDLRSPGASTGDYTGASSVAGVMTGAGDSNATGTSNSASEDF